MTEAATDRGTDGAILSARELVKEYSQGFGSQRVLDGVSLDVPAGRFIAVMGPSGSGKSTLLHLLAGLDTPTSGAVHVEGAEISQLDDRARTLLRRHRVGIVYQFFNLVPVLSAFENVALPAVIAGESPAAFRPRVDALLAMVGLDTHADKVPGQLAGGQQQRVAIARALVMEPAIILADEPTGNLDLHTGAEILAVLHEARRRRSQTIVMVTHDPLIAGHADEVQLLREGRFVGRIDIDAALGEANGHGPGSGADERHDPARGHAVLEWLRGLGAAGPSRVSS